MSKKTHQLESSAWYMYVLTASADLHSVLVPSMHSDQMGTVSELDSSTQTKPSADRFRVILEAIYTLDERSGNETTQHNGEHRIYT